MKGKKVLHVSLPLLVLIFSLLFSFCPSYFASALDLTQSVNYKTGYVMPYWSDNHNRTYASGGYNYSTNGDYENADILYFKSGTNSNISVSSGSYVSLTGNLSIIVSSSSQAVSIQANPRQYFVIGTGNVDCPVLSFDETSFQQSTTNSSNTWVLRYNFTSVCRLRSNVTQNVAMNISLRAPSASGTDTLRFVPTYLAIWEAVEGFDDSQIISAINTLNTTVSATNEKLDEMSSILGNIEDYSLRSADAQEQANDDANDRYQDEKDTINNAADDANDNASSQDYSFSIPNPFQAWFGGFSDNECVNIPNLAQWLHSNETRICTPWPSSVRTPMTTIVTGLLMLILFGFIISWVKKNDTGGN